MEIVRVVEHILLAIVIQLTIWVILRSWTAGAAAAIAWFVSREITQAEYRWIEHFGGGLRANMPWWGGLDPRVWQYADPWLDWIVPSVTVVAVALLARRAEKPKGPDQLRDEAEASIR